MGHQMVIIKDIPVNDYSKNLKTITKLEINPLRINLQFRQV